MSSEGKAAALTDEQIERVVAQLEQGASLRRACARAGIDVTALRWRRFGDHAVSRRVDAARVRGLLDRASRLRRAAAKLEARAAKI